MYVSSQETGMFSLILLDAFPSVSVVSFNLRWKDRSATWRPERRVYADPELGTTVVDKPNLSRLS
jgi:hypothetical protein